MPKDSDEDVLVLPTTDQTHDTFPHTSPWRNNLTALCNTHNFYILAARSHLHIYTPVFPSQSLPAYPSLILTSTPSSPHLPGHIDPHHPHSINNLVVAFLGSEEVVAVVRDDGDVQAWLVRHIVQAIARRAKSDNSLDITTDEVRPFFHINVGSSAWGLAIHGHARVLATSSNAHEIRIFRFALLRPDDDDDQEDTATSRRTDIIHRLPNGSANIPALAFCNTGDDPDARWLLTTDISGVTRILDIRNLQAVQAFRFGPGMMERGDFDIAHAGWGVMWLDRRSFWRHNGVKRAFGSLEVVNTGPVWDLEVVMDEVKARVKSVAPHAEDNGVDISSDIDLPDADANISSDGDLPDAASHPDANVSSDTNDDSSTSASPSQDTLMQGTFDPLPPEERSESAPYTGDHNSDFDNMEDRFGLAQHGPLYANATSPAALPPCPVLHTSAYSVYLLQPALAPDPPSQDSAPTTTPAFTPPLIHLTAPFMDIVPDQHMDFDRLNFSASIPELGIVVLGSQAGKALILALSRFEILDGREKGRVVFGMRPVKVLPEDREVVLGRKGLMVGVAAGRMQGFEGGGDGVGGVPRRWRILLAFMGGRVLGYEVKRKGWGVEGVELGVV